MSTALSGRLEPPAYRTPMETAASFLNQAPVLLMNMASALGLTVNMDAPLAGDIPGQITRVRRSGGARYHIDVNGQDGVLRQHFTLAHEIAHFLLHREDLEDALTDDRMYHSRLGGQVEWQANRLAAQLLMPEHLVRIAWRARPDVQDLATMFDVSAEAMEISLRELSLRT